MKYYIVENSLIARIGRIIMNSRTLAIVFGKTIHLSGTTKEQFLSDQRWFNHELVHIEQYQRLGYLNFVFQYLIESIKRGYINNKFEVEARKRSE